MKTQILEINKKLSDGIIDYKEARKELCALFSVKNKVNYSGRAIVKSNGNQQWIYEGVELPIIGLYTTYIDGHGVYPDGTREFKLSLVGTEFEFRDGHQQKTTVIAETDLEIIELNIT